MVTRKKAIGSLIYLILSAVAILVNYHKEQNTIIFAIILALSIILFVLSAVNLATTVYHNETCDDIEDREDACIETRIGEKDKEIIGELKETISVINGSSFIITLIIIILLILSFIL